MNKKHSVLLIFLFLFSLALKAQIKLGNDTVSISYSNPKEYYIGGITVSGAQHLDKSTLILLSGLNVGDKIKLPGDKTSDAIRNLWKQGLFSDIKLEVTKIQGDNVFFNIAVVERPRLSKFMFTGVSKSDADNLREKIKLIRGKVVTQYLISSIKQTVRSQYVDKGFLNTSVDVKEQKDSILKNGVILYINVKKGKRIKIHDIVFHGNTHISDRKLRHAMKDTKRKRWYAIFTSSKFIHSKYEKDKKKIIDKYNDKGYRDAKIVKDSVSKFGDDRVNIDITIDEGHKYYFGNISWVGNTKYSSKQLSNILAIKKGDVYNQSLLNERLFMNPNGSDISSLYMDNGYLFFQVTPTEVMVHNDTIDLAMHIYEGKQAIINKVTVDGNTKTNDKVIFREIRTRPGQLFRRSDVIRTQRELAQLGYFDPQKMNVTPTPHEADGTVDIKYDVVEKPSDQIELSGGWGAGTVVGTLGLSFNNFSARNMFKAGAWRPLPSGDGQKLSIRAQSNGRAYQSYNASFTEPWLGGKKPNSLSVSTYYTVETNGVPKKIKSNGVKIVNPALQAITITGLTIGYGKQLKWPDDYFDLYQEVNFQHYNLNNYSSVFAFSNGYANNYNYKLSIGRNSIDRPIFETAGSKITLSGEWTPPYSLFNGKDYSKLDAQDKYRYIEYQKYKFTASWFTKITNKKSTQGKEARNLVLNARVGFGFLGMYNKAVGASPFERFYLGGSGLTGYSLDGREIIALRGYDDQSLSPSTGATSICKYTLELRYPISLNPQATVFCLGFAEAGNSWDNIQNFDPFQVKRSAGVGVRIYLPMFGLLGFDYGWRFDDVPDHPGMSRGQFHFTIGQNLGEL